MSGVSLDLWVLAILKRDAATMFWGLVGLPVSGVSLVLEPGAIPQFLPVPRHVQLLDDLLAQRGLGTAALPLI